MGLEHFSIKVTLYLSFIKLDPCWFLKKQALPKRPPSVSLHRLMSWLIMMTLFPTLLLLVVIKSTTKIRIIILKTGTPFTRVAISVCRLVEAAVAATITAVAGATTATRSSRQVPSNRGTAVPTPYNNTYPCGLGHILLAHTPAMVRPGPTPQA